MVAHQHPPAEQLDQLFSALADATRRDILARVLDADASVTELAASYDMSFAAVQKHVSVLERAHLVSKVKIGREQRVTGNAETIRRANQLLSAFELRWRARIDRLDALLTTPPEGAPHAHRRDSQGSRGTHDDRRRPVRRTRRARVGRLR